MHRLILNLMLDLVGRIVLMVRCVLGLLGCQRDQVSQEVLVHTSR